MKKVIFFSFLFTALICSLTTLAQQEDKSKRASPPATLNAKAGDANLVIEYSQPAIKGRSLTELAPYGKVWRTGANEATTFSVDKDVKVEGKDLKAGKYALFTIPGQDEWTIIFNKQPNQWGAFKYDQAQDALRVQVKPGKAPEFTERMTFAFNDGKVALLWGDTQVSFSVQ